MLLSNFLKVLKQKNLNLKVTSNEINLLNRIKSLEANDTYSRAEVDRCLAKERGAAEMQQQLQYRVECLETELDNANRVSQE